MRRGASFLLVVLFIVFPSRGFAADKKKHGDTQRIGRRDINKGSWNLWSPERELELGRQLALEAERNTRLFTDPLVVAHVAEVAERVARNSDLQVPLQVRVVDSNEINAFALPGGFFYINIGMILETETEAELASIIAHETAHVAARHATKQMTKAQLWNWLSIPLLFFGGPVAYAVQQGMALAVPLTFLKFSRNAEREADLLGLQYLYASGYDPVACVDFFERMKQKEKDKKGSIAKAFSTHPMTKDRIVAAGRVIEEYLPSREEYVITTSRHDQVLAHLRDLLGERERLEAIYRIGPALRKRNKTDSPLAPQR